MCIRDRIGGTALSLQLGLRESYDFDFCVKGEFNNELLLEEQNEEYSQETTSKNVVSYDKESEAIISGDKVPSPVSYTHLDVYKRQFKSNKMVKKHI